MHFESPFYTFLFMFFGTFTVSFLIIYGFGGEPDIVPLLSGAVGAAAYVTIRNYWWEDEPKERSAGNDSSPKGMPMRCGGR
jgi:hypothetical protein